MKKSKAKQIISKVNIPLTIKEIPEYIAIERLKKYIDKCDGNELARLLGEFFGGKCFQDKNNAKIYNFMPNQYYANDFDDIK